MFKSLQNAQRSSHKTVLTRLRSSQQQHHQSVLGSTQTAPLLTRNDQKSNKIGANKRAQILRARGLVTHAHPSRSFTTEKDPENQEPESTPPTSEPNAQKVESTAEATTEATEPVAQEKEASEASTPVQEAENSQPEAQEKSTSEPQGSQEEEQLQMLSTGLEFGDKKGEKNPKKDREQQIQYSQHYTQMLEEMGLEQKDLQDDDAPNLKLLMAIAEHHPDKWAQMEQTTDSEMSDAQSSLSEAEDQYSDFRNIRYELERKEIFDNLKNYKGHHNPQLDPSALNNQSNKVEEQLKALIKLEQESAGDVSVGAKLRREKIETLERMTHFQEASQILSLIKERVQDGPSRRRLSRALEGKEGSDRLSSLVQEQLRHKNKFQKNAEVREYLEKQVDREMTKRVEPKVFDSISFGQEKRWGSHNYLPPSKLETRPEHQSSQVTGYKAYVEFMAKIEKEESQSAEKQINEYMRKFDQRFKENKELGLAEKDAIPYMTDFDGDVPMSGTLRPNDEQRAFQARFNPNVAMDFVTPSAKQIALQNVSMFMLNELYWREEVDAQVRAEVEAELPNQVKIVEEASKIANQQEREEFIKTQTKQFTDKYSIYMVNKDTLSGWFKTNVDRMRTLMQPQVSEALDKIGKFEKYDVVKEFEKANFVDPEGVQDFSKVSLDGPKDHVGEAIEVLNKGVVYDTRFSKNEKLEEAFEKIHNDAAQKLGLPFADYDKSNINLLDKNLSEKGQEIQNLAKNDLYHEYLDNNFYLAKSLEQINAELRKDVAGQSLKALEDLNLVRQRRDHLINVIEDHHREKVEDHSVQNGKIFDFIKFQEDQSKKSDQKYEQRKLKQLLQQRKNSPKFSENSKSAEDYERELQLLSLIAAQDSSKIKLQQTLEQFDFVFQCLKDNNVKMTATLRARLFEYLLLLEQNDKAVKLFKECLSEYSGDSSLIDPIYIEKFYDQCLKKDRFDGLIQILAYCEKSNFDMNRLDLQAFRPALNYYLGTKFNLSKIMTFLKYYQHTVENKAAKAFESVHDKGKKLTKPKIAALSKEIFGQYEDLVDINNLSEYLVTMVQDRQILHPQTNEDSLWDLINFFTSDKLLLKTSAASDFNKISGKTLATYIKYQFERPSCLDKLFKLALRVEGTELESEFIQTAIKALNEYQLGKEGLMPPSFGKEKLRELYLRLRATKMKRQDATFSADISELVLFLLSKAGMSEEIIDFCDQGAQVNSDIEKYYLAEALFGLDLERGNFENALNQSEIFSNDNLTSACQLTQRTKALFLDAGAETAVRYFREQMNKREEKATAQKDLLVKLYDEVMREPNVMSEKEFRKRYFTSRNLASKLIRDSYSVSKLKCILQDKDYDQIQQVFQLYSVMREEREIGGPKLMKQNGSLNFEDLGQELLPDQQVKLEQIRQRKMQLLSEISAADHQYLTEIIELARGEKLEAAESMTFDLLQKLQTMFEDMTYEEVEQLSLEAAEMEVRVNPQNKKREIEDSMLDKVQLVEQQTFAKLMRYRNEQAEESMKVIETESDTDYSSSGTDEEGDIFQKHPRSSPKNGQKVGRKATQDESESEIEEAEMSGNEIQSKTKEKEALNPTIDNDDESGDDDDADFLSLTEIEHKLIKRKADAGLFNVIMVDATNQLRKEHGVEPTQAPLRFKKIVNMLTDKALSNARQKVAKQITMENQTDEDSEEVFGQVDVTNRNILRYDANDIKDTMFQIREMQENFYEDNDDIAYDTPTKREKRKILRRLEKFNDDMLEGTSKEHKFDPAVDAINAHDETLFEYRQQILEAIRSRKSDILPVAIKMFNKMQDKEIRPSFRLDLATEHQPSIEPFSSISSKIDPDNIDGDLQKLEFLLNDPKSPIYSVIRSTSKYTTKKLPETFKKHQQSNQGAQVEEIAIDTNMMRRDHNKLRKLSVELRKIQLELHQADQTMRQKEKSVLEDMASQAFLDYSKKVKKDEGKEIDRQVAKQYKEYKKLVASQGAFVDRDLTDAQKVSLMKDALNLSEESKMFDPEIDGSSFPKFYALDLIQFGLHRDEPAAIRLGEQILSQNCASDPNLRLPKALSQAVKNYQFESGEKYDSAIRQTGPIDNYSLYASGRVQGDHAPVFFNKDDPYWQDMYAKNYKREDNWRLPTIYAWNSKPYGLVGEVVDMKDLEIRTRKIMEDM